MFRLIEPSSGQIQDIVLVHSVSAHMGSHNVCTHWMYQYYVLYLAWWWLNEPKHVAEFLILITNMYFCVYCLIKSLYYRKTQQDGSYQNYTSVRCHMFCSNDKTSLNTNKTCMRHQNVQSYLLSSGTVFKMLALNLGPVVDYRVIFCGDAQILRASSG